MEEEEPPGVPEWVVTYGDMMSLLLTFFIMLVSMSELKGDGSVRAMLDALNQAFGPTEGKFGVPGPAFQKNSMMKKPNSTGSDMEGDVKAGSVSGKSAKGAGGPYHSAKPINHGNQVTLGGPTAFGEHSWELTDRLKMDLDTIVAFLKTKKKRIMVRGHASPRPLPKGLVINHPQFKIENAWDLSFARALTVGDYLINEGGIVRERVIVSAVGDTEPHTIYIDSDSAQKNLKGINRRVDVFLIDSYIKNKDSED